MNDYRWADLSIGMNAEFAVELTEDMMKQFAGISGDYNPLHVDAQFARDSSYPGPVAFGMLTSAFYSRLVGMHLPGKHALLHGIDIEFKSPAFPGDQLTVTGAVSFLNDAYRRLELKARIINQTGKLISKATIRAGLNEL